MSKVLYPNGSDLLAYALAGGLTLDETQAATAVLAGIRGFEEATGRHFLAGKSVENATVAASTRYVDPAGNSTGIVMLPGDLAAAPSSIVYTPGVDGTPETWVAGTDYRLRPTSAPDWGKPYEYLETASAFGRPVAFGLGGSIAITGAWGYGTAIPEDAWLGMLLGGLLWLAEAEFLSVTDNFRTTSSYSDVHGQSVSQGNSGSGLRGIIGGWQSRYDSAIALYRKLVI